MSIGSVSGISSSIIAAPEWNTGGTAATAATQNAVTPPAAAVSQAAQPAPKQAQPFVLVPTEPLTPKVLAELIGRQLPLNGAAPPQ